MIDHGKQNILGVMIDAVDYDAACERIISAAHDGRPCAVSALAVHGVMTGALDAVHRHRLNRLDLVVPDGQPVRWAMKWLHGVRLPERVYGPELTLRVCERAAAEGVGVYLYGSTQDVLDRFAKNLKARYPDLIIAGSQPSRFRQINADEQAEIAATIRASGAGIVLVGLGCPRQETWVFENRGLLSMPLMAVGAAFDFHAGTVPQAPAWLQSRGLEWLYRFVQEPKRLWKRYVYLNPLYLSLIAMQWARLKTPEPTDTIRPTSPLRYG
jgi:N-acetylglucosaminyldiphosphoundecaprenol N-acetyl-beta-D-mannosaminyltransferase